MKPLNIFLISLSLVGSIQAFAASKNPFATGAQVIDVTGVPGVVAETKNNDVIVKYLDGSPNKKLSAKNLALTKGCTDDRFCVGQVVVNNGGHYGRIIGIFSLQQKVAVLYKGSEKPEVQPTKDVMRVAIGIESDSERAKRNGAAAIDATEFRNKTKNVPDAITDGQAAPAVVVHNAN